MNLRHVFQRLSANPSSFPGTVQYLVLLSSNCNHNPPFLSIFIFEMSKTIQIASPAQFSALLKSSRIVVTDCMLTPSTPPALINQLFAGA